MTAKTALIMAGGTGGHIFPGLALARELRARGWRVHWLGTPASMEERLVVPEGFAFEAVQFSGVRGKGLATLALAPLKLLRAFAQALAVVRRVRPDVVVGLGGYVSFPGGMMAVLAGKPLVLHEQNAVAGLANKVLAGVAERIFTTFPGVLKKGEWVGNPLRAAFLQQPGPAERFAGRTGPLRLLVVGGSLGARALNELVPQALALLPAEQRPQVLHQSGAKQIDALRAHYAAAGVQAELTPFIDDTAQAFAQALGVVRRVQPQVVIGLGGYISFPGGTMAVLAGKPLVLHEQNSVAGMANKLLAHIADRVFTAFPNVLPRAQWVGNPLRSAF